MTVLNRETSDKNINKVVGDFTKILLLEIRNLHDTFSDMAQDINATLFESLDHCGYSGVDVIRDISKTKGREYASMPYVFTSAIGLIKILYRVNMRVLEFLKHHRYLLTARQWMEILVCK